MFLDDKSLSISYKESLEWGKPGSYNVVDGSCKNVHLISRKGGTRRLGMQSHHTTTSPITGKLIVFF
jgi:hypothetical protein